MFKYSFYCCSLLLLISCQKAAEQSTNDTSKPTLTFTWEEAFVKDFPQVSAHRGGINYEGYPENSIEVFDYVHQKTRAIVECDIALTKDSVLIMMHDDSYERTTSTTGKVNQKTWEDLQTVQLKDPFGNLTNHKIPTLKAVLEWAKPKKVLFTLDIKRGVPFEMVLEQVKAMDYFDYAAIITYSIQDAEKIHALAPEAYLSVAMRNQEEIERVKNSAIPLSKVIAFTGTRLSTPDVYSDLSNMKIPAILGTLGNLDKQAAAKKDKTYQKFMDMGINILATDRPVEAYNSIEH